MRASSTPPTACFVSNDMMAVGALKGLHDSGLVVPRDVAIIAVGDPPFAAFTIPSLTTLAMPIAEAGQIAARLVMEALRADKPLDPQFITLGFQLRVRDSCGAATEAQRQSGS
jgi:LacI family transcriptional regulator